VKSMFSVFAIIALLGTSLPGAVATKRAIPPRPEELVGSWIGFWQDEEFTRLDLRADFTGYCAYVAPADSITHQDGVHVYRVTRWSLDGWELNTALTPVNPTDESVYLKGRVAYLSMRLEIGGAGRKWKERVVLHKESRIQASNEETRTKIDEVERR
jgi:hypothetical protein